MLSKRNFRLNLIASEIPQESFCIVKPVPLLTKSTVYTQVTYFAQSAPRPNLQPLNS